MKIRVLKKEYFLLAFFIWSVLFIISCSSNKEEKFVIELKKKLQKTINNVCNTLEDNNLEKSKKMYLLEKDLVRIDSLSIIWEKNIDSLRANLSEREINKIENENRLLYNKLAKTILNHMPEYKEIYR